MFTIFTIRTGNDLDMPRWPDEVFRGVFKAVFPFVLLVSNGPGRLLTETLHSQAWLLWLLGMAVVCALASEWVWRIFPTPLHQRQFVSG